MANIGSGNFGRGAQRRPRAATASARAWCAGLLGVAMAAGVGTALPAAAATPEGDTKPDTWQFAASIYGFLPTIDGKTTFPAGPSSITVDPSQLLRALNFTFMGAFDAHRGPWGVFTDVVYVDVGASKSQTRDFSLGSIGVPAATTADLHLDVKSWIWTLAGEFRVEDRPGLTVDLLAGTRYLSATQKLSWTISGNLGPIDPADRTGSSEAGSTLWDGIVGVRGKASFGAARQWSVPFYMDGGGGDSNSTFQVAAGLGYAFQWGDVTAMWRYLDYDLSGSKIRSLSFNGPQIGATFRW